MALNRRPLLGLLAAACLAAPGCERAPLDAACPAVAPGELVLSELSGRQAGAEDDAGQWVEVYGAAGRAIDLDGLEVRVRALDGTGERTVQVRRPGTLLAAGARAVIGSWAPATLPPDWATADVGPLDLLDLPVDGILELRACGETIDRVVYHGLPGAGTLALSGEAVPSAAANDADGAWCAVPTGTPGEENPPCP